MELLKKIMLFQMYFWLHFVFGGLGSMYFHISKNPTRLPFDSATEILVPYFQSNLLEYIGIQGVQQKAGLFRYSKKDLI